MVSLPPFKKQDLVHILKHWHNHRKSFVIKEATSLLGKLNYTAEVGSWARLLFVAIRSSLLNCMCKHKRLVMNRSHFKNFIADANSPYDDKVSILHEKFALSKLAKAIWGYNAKYFITKTLRAELDLLTQIIEDPSIRWSSPIAHLIKRTPDFQAWGDSSLDAAGGFSIDLGFYWHIRWPESITSKSLKKIRRRAYSNGELISINLLEYI